jgi:hypothetical protein
MELVSYDYYFILSLFFVINLLLNTFLAWEGEYIKIFNQACYDLVDDSYIDLNQETMIGGIFNAEVSAWEK